MERLTDQGYWDELWQRRKVNKSRIWRFSVLLAKRIFGKKMESYGDFFIWEVLYKKYLPHQSSLKILEVGSAPGWNLIKFKNIFGYEPFGVEFSSVGAEKNRQKFISANINKDNVVESDFFAKDFQDKYQNVFDLVISRGFIEHFDDVHLVIEKHLNLLKIGGYLIITIPNFQGLNYFFSRFFYKGIEQTHNFSIMNKESFLECFSNVPVDKIYCNYQGTLNLGLFVLDNKSKIKYWMYRFFLRVQMLFNLFFHILFGKKGAESKYFSPHLIFIGKKK